jgi:uncharacterized protein Yka (UPF0111/DUF47 family)
MISIQRLFGKEDRFFDLLVASAEEARRSIEDLTHVLRHEQEPSLEKFAALRKKDKAITQEINDLLVKSFVTALEREDIDALSTTLYKIPKIVEKFAERYTLAASRLGEVDFASRAAMLERATEVIEQMVGLLRKGMNIDTSKELNDKMQAIEAEADRLILELYRDTYASETDPMRYLILKDLFEMLEKAIDRCRDAGNVIHQIVIKNS